ncbi:putative double-stranded DNA-binding domain-containing protein [Cryptosporidium canis]|uniref:Double-stranded DNA-binding domain-containing protein n=1 Tax=Cryptosporidium canis TaxID=195482 RepID=A0ABQ8P6I9_9CRYT|nr:putative double-stranded DNA-binding domain-containing protein [Cryptosporidium canis]KAJ1612503.1 putative double-stranded DNA-binding domain-containing protein [Cryptosporidium canis]
MNVNDSNNLRAGKNELGDINPIYTKQEISQNEDQKRIEEQRRGALRAILENSAAERLSRIALVKPDKVVQIEDYILRTARSHGFSPYRKIQEDELISMISMMNDKLENTSSKIKICRRGIFDDDEDDELLL